VNFIDIAPHYIRAIKPYVPGKPVEEVERELGFTAIKLASNENPLGPSPKAVEAIRNYLLQVSRYPEDTGFYLRRRLAEHFKVTRDQVILGTGSSEILAMACHALLTPDCEVLTSEGSFVLYYLLAQAKGAKMVRVPMKDYRFDLAAMAERLSANTRIVFLANPNNPTGTTNTAAEVRLFVERAPATSLLVLDEAYFEYVDDPKYPNAFDYLTEGRPVLILRTFSKAYGLAGLRIGYGISRTDIIQLINKVRPPFNTSNVSQIAAMAAFEDHDHVRRSVRLTTEERQFLYTEFKNRSIPYVPSATNFILIDAGLPAADAFRRILRQGVIVRPMDGAGFPTMVRVTIGTRDENVKFLKALDSLR